MGLETHLCLESQVLFFINFLFLPLTIIYISRLRVWWHHHHHPSVMTSHTFPMVSNSYQLWLKYIVYWMYSHSLPYKSLIRHSVQPNKLFVCQKRTKKENQGCKLELVHCWVALVCCGLAPVHVTGASRFLCQQVRWIPTSHSRSSCCAGKLEWLELLVPVVPAACYFTDEIMLEPHWAYIEGVHRRTWLQMPFTIQNQCDTSCWLHVDALLDRWKGDV